MVLSLSHCVKKLPRGIWEWVSYRDFPFGKTLSLRILPEGKKRLVARAGGVPME